MTMWMVGGVAALAIAGLAATADAAVVCKKKSGAVLIRDACKKKEETVDLATLGALGPKGDKGDKGDAGAAGPLLSTLPSGQSLRGAWVVQFPATGSGVFGEGTISYTFPLESNPTVIIVQNGAPTPPGCTGDVANPGADAGNLCIFVAFVNGPCPTTSTYGPADGNSDYRFGAVVYMTATSASNYCEGSGTWAVTAP
jgi:hypothetical protein